MKRSTRLLASLALVSAALFAAVALALDFVPENIQQPGTQPLEIGNLEGPNKCDNCHGGYNLSVEPGHNWRGSMMANAGRDPIFWATVAIAEQDFGGAGDLCIRCHSTAGWLRGHSTPTDGSGLTAGDSDGVECDYCHKLTNPDDSEHLGVQFDPFLANDLGDPGSDPANVRGYYGSGMSSMWGGNDKLGPYSENDAEARHQFMQSQFHRSVDFCGTCHDVSNSAVGNLAHNNGTQATADPVVADGAFGEPVNTKAAFNNLPHKYGIVERTFSEYKSGLISQTLVSDYLNLPADLQGGALQAGYESALVAGRGGDYADGSPRYFTCQTCHMRPVNGPGCNKKGAPVRTDLPLHDMTGGNYWMPVAIQYLDPLGKLRLGGGLTSAQNAALNDGIPRAQKQLNQAATLVVTGNTLKVINHTGHKLISGYPEGRRMWLHVTWYDALGVIVGEDGAYGPLVDGAGNPVTVINPADGQPVQVESILGDLHNPDTEIYEAHYGLTQEWASQLIGLDYPAGLALSYDRYTGASDFTLGQLAASPPGTEHESFHFVLNNTVVKDNRIPPYGMSYEEARKRNALPMPANQFGGNPGGTYNYWDEISLVPPMATAVYATVELLYQPTSWEYIQFLDLANNGQNAFLADEGVNMLDAWLNAGAPDVQMAKPYVMAATTWTPECDDGLDNDGDGLTDLADPGCADASDASEKDDTGTYPCDDGIDNDSDGRADFDPVTAAHPGNEITLPAGEGDPGCGWPTWSTESPECQDGIDNDGNGMMDYDAGYFTNGFASPFGTHPQCYGQPWRMTENASICGLGVELTLVLAPLMWLSRRRRRSLQ